ncbi:AIPR family protein [Streptomyces sp. AA1529]|uniref:AIPR family protein n=1 Tax=Streptomyces sp. AA1529 TaxID=1203257 RepID=UPI0005653E43|nr:AIPR family protein [Streptomyces sp. AA1529]
MDRITEGLVKQFQQERGLKNLTQSEAFEDFAGFCVISSYFEDEFDPEEFRMGAGGDLGVDVAAIIINGDLLLDAADVRAAVAQARTLDVRFIISQAKTSPRFEAKVFTDLADNLVDLFTSDTLNYPTSPEIRNLRECIDVIYADLGKLSRALPALSIRYASTGVVGDSMLEAKRKAAVKRLDQTNYFGEISSEPLGARELRDLYQRATSAVSAEFTMPKRITLPRMPLVEQAFLGILSASDLVRVITDPGGGIRKTLFFENVRDFQDYNPVNLEIQQTVKDVDNRDRFAVLNNGITIVARELTLAGDDIRIRDFQIVNGCQTCHVLFDEKANLTEGIHVNVRLIQTREENVITGITTATNRQTAVTDEDLQARDAFHKELEGIFQSFPESERLYYERRSRQYSSQQSIEKTRIVTRSLLTRTFASMFLHEPSRAGRYYKELKEAREEDLFRPDQSALAYYASAATAWRIEWLFRNKRIDRKYTPAKYQLLMAVKIYLLGTGDLPKGNRLASRECQKILDVIWDPIAAEGLIQKLLPAVDVAAAQEDASGVITRDTVRTQRFAENLRREVQGLGGAKRE